jgi:sulfur carrier protein
MQIQVNGEPRDVNEGATLGSLLEEMEIRLPHVAVELNLEVVPRAEHGQTNLREGDRLEIVTLVGGG